MSARLLLYPFAIIYGLIVYIRNKLFDLDILPSKSFDLPVICVGNLSAGGTGKTPHVEYLISLLKDDFKVAVLSRGYGRKTKNFRIANNNPSVEEIGDEPLQIKQKFKDILVAVCEKRVDGIEFIQIADKSINTIVLDDAYQHRWVKPGFSILLMDYNKPLFRDHLLPAGNLRESRSGMKRADVVIITKTKSEINRDLVKYYRKRLDLLPGQHLFFTGFHYKKPVPLLMNGPEFIEGSGKEYQVVLVTGIANSKPLVDFISEDYRKVIHLEFRDHHSYSIRDVKQILKRFNEIDDKKTIILTTEKDAWKLRNILNSLIISTLPFFYIPVEVKFMNTDEETNFKIKITDYVNANIRSDKGNN